MFSMAILKQDFKINNKVLLVLGTLQLTSILLAVGICEMNLIQISDIFWDTIPVIILPAVLEMILAYEVVTKRAEDGTMDFILATSIKPERILATKAFAVVLSGIVMILISAGIGWGTRVYRLTGVWKEDSYIRLNVGACLLQFFISGYCFFIACRSKNLMEYIRRAVLIPFAMYAAYLGYYLVERLFFLQYITFFSLFRQTWYAQDYFMVYVGLAVFLLGGVICFILGRKAFYSHILNYQ